MDLSLTDDCCQALTPQTRAHYDPGVVTVSGIALLFWLLVAGLILAIVYAMAGRRNRVPSGLHNTPDNTPVPPADPEPDTKGGGPSPGKEHAEPYRP